MINRTAAILLAAMVLAVAVRTPADAGELEDRDAIVTEVSALFVAEDFDALDGMAEAYRTQESRTGSGLWKLTMFYSGLYVPREGPGDEAYWAAVEEKFLRWAARNPHSTAARIGYAGTLVDHAWFFRGIKLARDVPKEAWAPFREYLAKARRYLEEHKQVAGADPQWYRVMLVVARGESWPLDRFVALVEEGTAKHPYFYEIYFKAIDHLLPKWHGSTEMIAEFANLAVERTQAREGAGMYARIYWYTSQVQYGPHLFTGSEVVWSKMSAGIDDVLARYPDQWNINNFAHFACLARDREKAAALVARIEGAPIESAWANNLATYKVCRTWVGG